MGIFDKAKNLISSNPDKAHQIIEKAGDLVDKKTGGKYAEHVDKGQDFMRSQVGAEQHPAPPATQPPSAPEGVQPPADLPVEGAPPVDRKPPA